MVNIKILPENIHGSWGRFLDSDTLYELSDIEKKIGSDYTPPAGRILRFMSNDIDRLKAVILGQDPYPERGVAMGRAFEVGGLTSWNSKFRQVSLKNIIRLIYKTYNNIEDYNAIKPFSIIKEEIDKGKFNILPANKLFESWERQGVLLLNACLTCEVGKPGSHAKIWSEFTRKLLGYISGHRPDLCWFLWGSNANAHAQYISNGQIFKCRHPMMCSNLYEDDFLKSDCFKETSGMINWLG